MEDGGVVPLLQYVVLLAVIEAIKEVCDKNAVKGGLFRLSRFHTDDYILSSVSLLVPMVVCVVRIAVAALFDDTFWSGKYQQGVIVQDNPEGQLVDNVVTIQGLTSSGYLLAVRDDGRMCELHPDGNGYHNTMCYPML
ncbi:hypothetical protein Ancab_038254 [Ancistrocladus abbreviatus]